MMGPPEELMESCVTLISRGNIFLEESCRARSAK